MQPAFVALTNAKARAGKASEREQALIDALAKRYTSDPEADGRRSPRPMPMPWRGRTRAIPDDQDIAVLFADAVMNTSPWDYWELDGRTPKGRLGEAVAAIEGVLAANPDHPGAIHLYIHLTEASAEPEKAEPYADRLAALMPAAGHIVHMPAHTYYRIGRYLDSLKTNVAAVAADEAYLAQVEAAGVYPYGYYPHNIHFVLVSAFNGRRCRARDVGRRAAGGQGPGRGRRRGRLDPGDQAGALLRPRPVQRPDMVLGLDGPGRRFPAGQGDVALRPRRRVCRKGELEQARREAAQIAEISQTRRLRDDCSA